MTDLSPLPATARAVLHNRFGHQTFRAGQESIISALLQGQDVLAVMPTGSGKSLCYQLPAILYDGCTIVISPLIALMQDQVDALRQQDIAATFINSSLSATEQQTRLRACSSGAYDLLYVAPERFRNTRFLQAVTQMRVSLFAVDEAHCISTWGHDFRPDYLRLRQAIELLQQPQVLALTATATLEVQQDIMQQLGRETMQRFVSGFDRPNLTYQVLTLQTSAAKLEALADLLRTQNEGSTIVYAATRRAVEEIGEFLHRRGTTSVLLYHAGLTDEARRRAQETFMEQPRGVMVATNAFGMGVDKSDVRCVVHFNLPRSMEAYYQEAGRAGRDGRTARCVLFYSYGDVRIQEFLLEQNYPPRALVEEVYGLIVAQSRRQPEVPLHQLLPLCHHSNSAMQLEAAVKLLEKAGYVERLSAAEVSADLATGDLRAGVRLLAEPVAPRRLALDDAALQQRKQHELGKMRRMVGYASATQCRRRRILGYFGEAWQERNCGACDVCLGHRTFGAAANHARRDLSEAEWLLVQKILSCVARMRGRYGRARVMQVLTGSRARELRDTHLTRLSTYGILRHTPRAEIELYLDALLDAACIQIVGDEYPKLDLTECGWAVMRRQQTVRLALPATTSHVLAAPGTAGSGPSTVPDLMPEVVEPLAAAPHTYDAMLFEGLRARRTALARAESVPPYCIFSDRTLREIVAALPTDQEALLRIHGIGPAKVSKYGDTILALVRDHRARPATPRDDGET